MALTDTGAPSIFDAISLSSGKSSYIDNFGVLCGDPKALDVNVRCHAFFCSLDICFPKAQLPLHEVEYNAALVLGAGSHTSVYQFF